MEKNYILEDISKIPENERFNMFKSFDEKLKDEYLEYMLKSNNIFFNSYAISKYISVSPDELKLKYLDYYCTDIGYDIISNCKDPDVALEIATRLFEKNQSVYLIFLCNNLPEEKLCDFFDIIVRKEKVEQKNYISNFEIEKILKRTSYKVCKDIIENHIMKDLDINREDDYTCDGHRFDSYSFLNILELLSEKKENEQIEDDNHVFMDYFEYIVNSYKDRHYQDEYNSKVVFYNLDNYIILLNKEGYQVDEILDKVLSIENFEEDFSINQILEHMEYDLAIKVCDYLLNYLRSHNIPMKDYAFFSIIDCLKDEDIERYFLEYTKDEYIPMFNIFNLITTKNHKMDFYLDIIIRNCDKKFLEENVDKMIDLFQTHSVHYNYDDKQYRIIEFFATSKGFDPKKIKIFADKVGLEFIKYLNDPFLVNILNMDEKYINRLLDLFDDKYLYFNKQRKYDILNSILQAKFIYDEKDTYNLFSKVIALRDNGEFDEINHIIDNISNEIDVNKILKDYNITLDELKNEIKEGNTNALHDLINKYIGYKREVFVKDNLEKCQDDLVLRKVPTRESYKDFMYHNSKYTLQGIFKDYIHRELTEEQKYILSNSKLIMSLCDFKCDPKNVVLNPDEKEFLKPFSELIDYLYDEEYDFIFLGDENSIYNKSIKYETVQKKVQIDHLINIAGECNFSGLLNVLKDDELYEELKKYLEDYKIIGWDNTFDKLLLDADIEFNDSSVAALLSNFDKISTLIQNGASLTKVLSYSSCFASVTNYYSILLGKENYDLIAANEGKNKSTSTKAARLIGVKKLIPDMYKRESITVPTINDDIEASNGKKLHVNLGNVTNMINFTYGERTEACMRKFGAFDALFDYCIQNENGFHVRITDPKTGEFVSRVSGFRNGNTVFLNELRESVNPSYDREDLYNVIKEVARRIVEESKGSKLPIDNVLITSDMAMENHKDELLPFDDAASKALKKIPNNYNKKGICLASTDNGKIVDFNFTKDVPKYDVVRDDITIYKDKNASIRINQLLLLNKVVNGESIDDVELKEYETDYVISGEDFFVSVLNGEKEVFVLDIAKDNKKTLAEISMALRVIDKVNTDNKGSEELEETRKNNKL